MSEDPLHELHLVSVLEELEALRRALLKAERDATPDIEKVDRTLQASASNLVHYVALRQLDVRPLQLRLSQLGLSSLGRAEAHVLGTLDAVIHVLRRMLGHSDPIPLRSVGPSLTLAEHTQALLGGAPTPLIMVTMPSEASHSYELVRELLVAGMNVMRVNCAHDDETAFRAMTAHLRRASAETGLECRVLFDLPGPKLRTLDIEPGPRVLRLSPDRDAHGRVVKPARVYLSGSDGRAPEAADATVRLASHWIARLGRGHTIHVRDASDRKRTLEVVEVDGRGAWAHAYQTVYVTPETAFTLVLDDEPISCLPSDVPAAVGGITLHVGDALRLTRAPSLGRGALCDESGRVTSHAQIACAVPSVLDHLEVGQPVWFDDGKIGGHVEAVTEAEATIRIRHAKAAGATLRADRGINLPDTALDLPALGADDLAALDCAVDEADLVGLSFARSPDDVKALHAALAERSAEHLGVVLKVETQRGFEELPRMLLEALKRPPVGVMIARGDLAVECGFERLAELQEEILWICEAAHVPCIWATQVLESLTKKGAASRAEITDAAMAERAECVMLNKGPHVVRAVGVLRDIMARMRDHQQKKTSMLRPLRSIRLSTPPRLT